MAFTSIASNLVSGDTNGQLDVFVHDRVGGGTVRVDETSAGAESGQGASNATISADGRFVTFTTYSELASSDTSPDADVYVQDRDSDEDGVFDEPGAIATVQMSVATDGTGGNAYSYGRISPNGRYVAIGTNATNLFAGDQPVCQRSQPDPLHPFGPPILVPADCPDVVLHDRDANGNGTFDEPGGTSTTLVSQTSAGAQADGGSGDPDVANDGTVAFYTLAANLGASPFVSATIVRDGPTGQVALVGTQQSNGPSISDSGRYVAFDSYGSNGIPNDTNNVGDAFVVDRPALTTRVSVDVTGGEVAMGGLDPVVSGDGRHVLFLSFAPNLVAGDTNGQVDLFVRDTLGAPAGSATSSGSAVVVQPADPITAATPVQLTFSSVSTTGTTHLTVSTDGPTPNSGFLLGNPPRYYDISTTADFSGPVTICITYDPAAFTDEGSIRLQHFDLATYLWVDITTVLDTGANRVCGTSASFSPFAVFQRALVYAFTGFYAPIDNAPTVNSLKAGSAVPVKFGLGGDRGLTIFAQGSPASRSITCNTGAPIDQVEQTVSASASGLTYEPGSGRYLYVWKTDKAWAGTCRQLILTLRDGSTHVAVFKFTR